MPSRRPAASEHAPFFARYIERVRGSDVLAFLGEQERALGELFESVSEEGSLHRYAPGKWTIRGVLGHVNDGERTFAYRAMWFARGLEGALPSFEEGVAAAAAGSDDRTWASHVAEFRALRAASRALLENLPAGAWDRVGVASGHPVSVRAMAYVIAGHAEHHHAVLRERYGLG